MKYNVWWYYIIISVLERNIKYSMNKLAELGHTHFSVQHWGCFWKCQTSWCINILWLWVQRGHYFSSVLELNPQSGSARGLAELNFNEYNWISLNFIKFCVIECFELHGISLILLNMIEYHLNSFNIFDFNEFSLNCIELRYFIVFYWISPNVVEFHLI